MKRSGAFAPDLSYCCVIKLLCILGFVIIRLLKFMSVGQNLFDGDDHHADHGCRKLYPAEAPDIYQDVDHKQSCLTYTSPDRRIALSLLALILR